MFDDTNSISSSLTLALAKSDIDLETKKRGLSSRTRKCTILKVERNEWRPNFTVSAASMNGVSSRWFVMWLSRSEGPKNAFIYFRLVYDSELPESESHTYAPLTTFSMGLINRISVAPRSLFSFVICDSVLFDSGLLSAQL